MTTHVRVAGGVDVESEGRERSLEAIPEGVLLDGLVAFAAGCGGFGRMDALLLEDRSGLGGCRRSHHDLLA
jgi:hypothetical protein